MSTKQSEKPSERDQNNNQPFHDFEVALHLNNLGARLIQMKFPENAKSVLEDAMVTMKLCVQEENFFEKISPSYGNSEHHPKVRRGKKLIEQIGTSQRKRNVAQRESSTAIQSQIVAYQQPVQVVFPSRDFLNKRENYFSAHSEATVAILYNMALVHHICGMENNSQRLKQHALTLYEMAQMALPNLEVYFTHDNINLTTSASLTLSMAVLNNMGQIHHDIGSYTLARHYFEAIMVIRDEVIRKEGKEKEEWDIFVLNSMFTDPPVAASAA